MSVPRALGCSTCHESARGHVTGACLYTDDMPEPSSCLHAALVLSPAAHATIEGVDVASALSMAGVLRVFVAGDLPHGGALHPFVRESGDPGPGEPLLADGVTLWAGQPVALVVADTWTAAVAARAAVGMRLSPRQAILSMGAAMEAGAFLGPPATLTRHDAPPAGPPPATVVRGGVRIGGQEHFYLEGQVALAEPGEGGRMRVHASTQHPAEVQSNVAAALGVECAEVEVIVRRMGGGFGGKESQSATFACLAAVAARALRRPVKLRLDRDDDFMATGKRHPFEIDYEVACDPSGGITRMRFVHRCDGGALPDLTVPVATNAMLHADNAYHIPDMSVESRRCRTNLAPNTAFRGFGAPQGMLGMERALDHAAFAMGRDPLDVRKDCLYGPAPRDTTPFGMTVEGGALREIVETLESSSRYRDRRREIDALNADSPVLKRGIALTPVKFGISYHLAAMNQAGALAHVYTDGSVRVAHGGTEMGQGLHTKMAQVAADVLCVPLDRVRVAATSTGEVPNTSATAASTGADMNGMAVLDAATTLRRRLTAFAASRAGAPDSAVSWRADGVWVGSERHTLADLARAAWEARVSLSATGYYRTPGIDFNFERMRGRPMYYFAYGAAVSEALVDTLTGESRVTRVDILHDAGNSLNPAVDLGQVEGAYMQGLGWLTTEELVWDAEGVLRMRSPSTYKVPVASDRPPDMRIQLRRDAPNARETLHRSKAVGEPPLPLALSAFFALSDAVAAAGSRGIYPCLNAPATPEEILAAVGRVRGMSS